jgi:hypothetical protein
MRASVQSKSQQNFTQLSNLPKSKGSSFLVRSFRDPLKHFNPLQNFIRFLLQVLQTPLQLVKIITDPASPCEALPSRNKPRGYGSASPDIGHWWDFSANLVLFPLDSSPWAHVETSATSCAFQGIHSGSSEGHPHCACGTNFRAQPATHTCLLVYVNHVLFPLPVRWTPLLNSP